MLDGTIEPMPTPELDVEDTHLNRALEELARLVDAPVQEPIPTQTASQSDSDADGENLIPQPLPEPIPIEVPLPPTPVIVTQPINASLSQSLENANPGERDLLAELAALSAGTPVAETHDTTIPAERSPVSRGDVGMTPFRLAMLSLVLFVAGMLTERFVRLFEHSVQPVAVPEVRETVESELTGRITYKTKQGDSQPDHGARVLIFPVQRSGELKLSPVGFRPADLREDQLVANAVLKAMGGGGATVDDRGTYRLPIDAGSYRILVLSHFQVREGTETDVEVKKLLSEYFENPAEVLGRLQYEFSALRVKGTGDIWDHSF
jgi:hypothetical protein